MRSGINSAETLDGRESVYRRMDHSPKGCGVIHHNQTEVLSPNATVGVVDHSLLELRGVPLERRVSRHDEPVAQIGYPSDHAPLQGAH